MVHYVSSVIIIILYTHSHFIRTFLVLLRRLRCCYYYCYIIFILVCVCVCMTCILYVHRSRQSQVSLSRLDAIGSYPVCNETRVRANAPPRPTIHYVFTAYQNELGLRAHTIQNTCLPPPFPYQPPAPYAAPVFTFSFFRRRAINERGLRFRDVQNDSKDFVRIIENPRFVSKSRHPPTPRGLGRGAFV